MFLFINVLPYYRDTDCINTIKVSISNRPYCISAPYFFKPADNSKFKYVNSNNDIFTFVHVNN